jgi:hypothetical protein
MFRVACVTAVLVAIVSMSLPAQGRFRDEFGRVDWCADNYDRGSGTTECRILEATLGNGVIDVDAGQNGGIRVRGWDRPESQIRVKATAWARTASRARDVVESVRLSTDNGHVRASSPLADRDWAASFELQVPRNVRLTLNAHNGGLSLDRFDGTAEMQTVNGGIAVTDASGDIHGWTQNGGITVSLTGRRWEGRGLDLETRNGGVSILVPPGYSAELDTGTSNGHMRIGFPIAVTGSLNRRVRTTLGSGGAPIRALTTNGGVTIMQR